MQYGKTQEEEMKLAVQEKRQPICVYCNHPLDMLVHYQETKIVWTYDTQLKKYLKDYSDEDVEKPFHRCGKCKCESADGDFIDYNLIDF